MLTNTTVNEVRVAEGSSNQLKPAALPVPDHFIRMCPWALESADLNAQLQQINEEFEEYNQDVTFITVSREDFEARRSDLELALKKEMRQLKEADSGALLAIWLHPDQKNITIGAFDNGGVNICQQEVAAVYEDVAESIGSITHFTTDTLNVDYQPFAAVFESLQDERTLHPTELLMSRKPVSRPRANV